MNILIWTDIHYYNICTDLQHSLTFSIDLCIGRAYDQQDDQRNDELENSGQGRTVTCPVDDIICAPNENKGNPAEQPSLEQP